ncbi:hypothetical protein BGZ68_003219 [Mortierella alpina]|nr:hypothetical protein BGZ68_003219 [Mortierella alpina]
MPVYRTQDLPSGVIQECHAQFARLPKHGKPSRKGNGQAEWTILAGIVMSTPTGISKHKPKEGDQHSDMGTGDNAGEHWDVECISLATGSKCLPRGKQSPRGDLINDCHAEILARRGFNKWCLLEMQAAIKDPNNTRNRFRYTGDSGDATTASLALTQTEESKGAFFNGRQTRLDTGFDANTKDNVTDEHGCYSVLGFRRGRIDYDSVGVLRTKPGRVDSEPTMSMSCSDKIARWSILGLTSALVAPFIAEPMYLTSVIAGDLFDETALERALFKRISGCPFTDQGNAADEGTRGAQHQADLPHPVSVHKSTEAFDYSKDIVAARSEQEGIIIPPVASPCSTSWIASEPSVTEVLVNGCKAGASTKKQISAKARSRLCKINMFQTSAALWKSIPGTKPDLVERMIRSSGTGLSEETESHPVVYKEWKRLSESHWRSRERLLRSSFRNWIKSDDSLEMFDIEGNIDLAKPRS